MQRGPDIVPIPGTKRRKYLEDNCGAVNVKLSSDDLAQLDRIGDASGLRYADMRSIDA